ncbi:hypothetical protein PISMIDRAFT_18279 [Pisolithus microcarpus 441]|uniref:Unplaced genomic scaffold scaffold_342, whole genome shotgun sequence n=1 Tax=Pisolithus microcarpus 441 TaxID=765257 RepID=A0A0C9XL75_9AGAM|nr:hypothetical protein PISMIDRAFT_18279 [Pisolithus microcarpus 441]
MCDDVPNFQRCDGYNAPLNTRPYALFDSSLDDAALSPQLSSISSQVELSSLSSFDELRADDLVKERRQSEAPLFTNPFCSPTVPAPVVCRQPLPTLPMDVNWQAHPPALLPRSRRSGSSPPCDPDRLFPPSRGDLVPASPDYFNYVWTLAIYDRGYPFDGKTEEQNDRIRMLSEVYRGTDLALDCVPDLLSKTRVCPTDSLAESLDRTLADLTINISAIQYKLVLELSAIVSAEECRSFRNREVDRHVCEAKKRGGSGQDTPATAGSSVGEKCTDVTVKVEEAEPDPWSLEPIEFAADDGYSKKRDASFSETAKFLAETVPSAASAFHWRQFLDSAAWNKADHALHNAINTTEALPSATFHPVVVDSMLRLYLTGRAPVPLAHPLYQYSCYDCRHFGHWSCRNGRGSRWTPASNLSTEGENEGSCRSTTRPIRSSRRRSPTPGPSVNPGRSGVRRA